LGLKINEKRSEETQTLRAGCSKAEPKNFTPLQTSFPGAWDGQNLISWRWSLPLPTTQFGEDGCTQFRVIVVTDPPTPHTQTHTPTYRQDQLQYTAPWLARSVIKTKVKVMTHCSQRVAVSLTKGGPTDEVEKFSHLVSQVSTTGGTEQDAATRLGGKSQNSFEGDR